MKFKHGLKPFQVQADETQGEHSRLIEFVVWARTLPAAEKKARKELDGEWVCAPDKPEEDAEHGVISYFGGEILVDDIRVEETTVEKIVLKATRSAPRFLIEQVYGKPS